MLTLPPSVRIYLAVGQVDMRRGHDGLAAIVRGQWKLDLYGGHLFVFLGRRADRCKILFWDRGGFVLYYKRLERGRFRLPRRCLRRDVGDDRRHRARDAARRNRRRRREAAAQVGAAESFGRRARVAPKKFLDRFDHLRGLCRKGIDRIGET